MSIKIEICNLALSRIGANAISALTDSSKEARELNKIYEPTKEIVLSAHDWNCARRRASLVLSTDTINGWDYVYAVPSDCLVARSIYTSDPSIKIPFESAIRATTNVKRIYTNEESAELIYTSNLTDASLFEPMLVNAFAFLLAADLSQPLRGKLDMHNIMMQRYNMAIEAAKPLSANQNEKAPDDSSSFTRARS